MYYSSGNYEAFARPVKPEGVEHKSAYLVGSGLAALTAACYLVRDGQMPGRNIHILEKEPIAGGACDGWHYEGLGYVMRGGREMDNHFEVMWDLFRSIPSIETEGVSVLDEYYWLNKKDPNYSLCRATVNRGEDAHTDGKFALSDKAAMEIMNAKAEKDLRGSINRRVNCDAANLDKAVEAAQEQLESIRKLQRAGLLDQLPDKLQLTAALRLENPELTLSELAEEFDPPVTKSCLNHRLRKITQLAKGL